MSEVTRTSICIHTYIDITSGYISISPYLDHTNVYVFAKRRQFSSLSMLRLLFFLFVLSFPHQKKPEVVERVLQIEIEIRDIRIALETEIKRYLSVDADSNERYPRQ